MCTKEQIQEVKQYLSEQGYGTGSNFTVNAVANLMAEWLAKKCNIPHVIDMCCPYCHSDDIVWYGLSGDCICNKCGKDGSIIL